MTSKFPWFPSLDALKVDLDIQLGQVGEIDSENRVITYRPRNNGTPTLFCANYEVADGKYRLNGKVRVMELCPGK